MCVDLQEGGTRGAPSAVRGSPCALDPPLQRLLFCPPVQARGRLGPGARGHLGALRAPVGARRCGGGHRITLPAELAGVWEVGGRGAGVKGEEQEIVRLLAKNVPELQQAGANAAPIVSVERFLLNRLPLIVRDYPVVVEGRYDVFPVPAGLSLVGRHIIVTSGEVGHKSVPSETIRGTPVEEGHWESS